jgi:hypothetical protein
VNSQSPLRGRSLQDISIKDRSIAFFLFGFLLACYLLTYTGVIQSSDGLAMFATAESIVRRGEIDSNQLLWMDIQQGHFGPDGELYVRKGVGTILLALPLVWLARLWPAIGLVQTALLLNPILTAWTGALLYRSGQRLGWNRTTSVATALIFGLATLAWPYTQEFFSDPVCAFGLYGAFHALISYSQTQRKRYLLAGGIGWSVAYLARTINLVTLPLYLIALGYILWRNTGTDAGRLPLAARLGRLARAHWRPVVSFLMPVVLAGLFSLWWNWARYGNVWDSGYEESERFSAIWWFGVTGLLAGPARGLLWYSPALLLALPGAVWFWRKARPEFYFCVAITLLYVLLYGKWYMWHGGYSWGPRFLVPIVPFVTLLAGPAWNALVQERRFGLIGQMAAVFLVILSAGVQWLGMLVPFGLVQEQLAASVQPLFAPETFTTLAYSPLLLQWRYLTAEHIHLAWWRNAPWPGRIDWFGLAIPLSGVLFGVVLLVRQMRSPDESGWADSTRDWVYTAGLCVIALAMLTYQYTASAASEMGQAAQRIQQLEERDDAVLLLLPAHTQEFANLYHGRLPAYGFFQEGSLGDADTRWLEQIQRKYRRIWLVPDDALPEQSGWERALRFEDFLLLDTRRSTPDGQPFALYAVAAAQPLQEAGLGTIFGDPTLVDTGINEENGWMRLAGYAVTPETYPGGELMLELRWESLRPVDYNYQVFVHLLNAGDEKLAQRDGQPVQWMRPTSTWRAGEELFDRYGMLLPADLPPGSYTVAVGLYDPVSGQRLPVSAGPRDYAIEIGPIIVSASRPD